MIVPAASSRTASLFFGKISQARETCHSSSESSVINLREQIMSRENKMNRALGHLYAHIG